MLLEPPLHQTTLSRAMCTRPQFSRPWLGGRDVSPMGGWPPVPTSLNGTKAGDGGGTRPRAYGFMSKLSQADCVPTVCLALDIPRNVAC